MEGYTTGKPITIADAFSVMWIPVGHSFQGFTNKGNHDLVWIGGDMESLQSSLKILVATQSVTPKMIANGIKKTIAHQGHSMKYPEVQEVTDWVKNNKQRI
jgi:hypothetical protein